MTPEFNAQGISLPESELPLPFVNSESIQYRSMESSQVCFDLLCGIFKEVALHSRGLISRLHLPDQMKMVGHYHECIELNSFVLHKESEAVNDNILVFVRMKQLFPFLHGYSKVLRPFNVEACHRTEMSTILLVYHGEKAGKKKENTLPCCWCSLSLFLYRTSFGNRETPTMAEGVESVFFFVDMNSNVVRLCGHRLGEEGRSAHLRT